MTVAIDTNVLIHASDQSSSFHDRAIELLGALAIGPDLVHVFWPVALGYLRIATHPTIFQKPLSTAEAMANVRDLVSCLMCALRVRRMASWDAYREVAIAVRVRGNLVRNARIVTLMRQHGVSTIWSHDRAFLRFPGISVRDCFV